MFQLNQQTIKNQVLTWSRDLTLQAPDIDLAEDSDWRGTNVVVAGRVRLNGHRLWLDNLAGIESIPGLQV